MPDIDKLTRRPMEYLGETGIPFLAGGLVWLLLGCSILVQHAFPKSFVVQEVLPWVAIAACVGALRAATAVKQRAVFPRGGYVEPRPHGGFRKVLWFVLFTILFSLVRMSPRGAQFMESRFFLPGFALAAAMIWLVSGWRERAWTMMWFGAYLLCLAPLVWWLPVNNYERWAWAEIAIAIPILITGAIRFRRFLKTNPPPLESPHG